MPSSRFLIKRMLNSIDFSKNNILIEFGPGNGIITKEILKKLTPNSKIICFELNTNFVNHLNKIEDDRIIIINKSADKIKEELIKLGIHKIDYCISSLPLTNIPNNIGISILKKTNYLLKPTGLFIQYQYSLTFLKKLKNIFSNQNVSIQFEMLNFPPAFVYICKKK